MSRSKPQMVPDIAMVPTTTVEVADESTAKKVLHLLDLLEDHDDVQNVYANFDIPDAVMETLRVLARSNPPRFEHPRPLCRGQSYYRTHVCPRD